MEFNSGVKGLMSFE